MAKELFSREIERALLGVLIQNPSLMTEVKGALEISDFYFKENQDLFKAIEKTQEIHGDTDQILIVDQFSLIAAIPKEEARIFVADFIIDSGIETNISNYIDVIRERRKQRDVKSTLSSTSDEIDSKDKSALEIIGDLENNLRAISEDADVTQLEGIESLTNEFEMNIKELAKTGGEKGIKTGFKILDSKIGGFRGGQFVIIAARPSVGKTAFSLALAQEVALKHKVGFFSLEMPSDQIIMRMLTNISRIPQWKIERMQFANQNETNSFNMALTRIKSLNFWLDDSPTLNVNMLGWKARKLKKEKGLDIIFIDYLQLLEGERALINDRQQAVSRISKGLKALARQLDIPIIALSQLSRKTEEKGGRPLMSHIRESGSIEQDADIIAFLHRDDYQKDGDDELANNSPLSNIEVIIAKHRNGSTGSVMMELDKAHGSIREINSKGPMKT